MRTPGGTKNSDTTYPEQVLPTEDGSRRRPYFWVVAAVIIVALGLLISITTAGWVARGHAKDSRQNFERTALDVTATLQRVIQREDDLVVNGGAYFAEHPNATNAEFLRWLSHTEAFDRYPELSFIGYLVIVPAKDLPAFAKRAEADTTGLLAPSGRYVVVPSGKRSFYCLAAAGTARGGTLGIPAGVDLCMTVLRPGVLNSRDSGQRIYVPAAFGGLNMLGSGAPVYRGGVTPSTTAARRASFLGALGIMMSPETVLVQALQGHPNTAVSLHYSAQGSQVTFSAATIPKSAQSLAVDLHNGWTVQTYGAVESSGIFSTANAVLLLVLGVLLSLLAGVLVLVLVTSRARALNLVRARTHELRHQALHDALTGLPNRSLIMDRADQLLRRGRRLGTGVAALFIDLDDFKDVNDTLGHEAGDHLLQSVATRLRASLRDADTIGRMGGDEFVVLIDSATLDVAPDMIAQRLLGVMRQPFEFEGAALPLTVHASIGIALGDRETAGDLIRDADVALYQAKTAGKNCFQVFHPEMHDLISRRIGLEFDLRSALTENQYRLVYQPIYDLADLSLVGVEALLRWDHPVHGTIEPQEFIPILESTGQIVEVGRWVLCEACRQMANWHARGATLDVSVNVSARQLDTDGLVQDVADALHESGLAPKSLIIEVTETALMRNVSATAEHLRAVKSLGVRIAIDDFGTGYSSLAYLHQFPVDCLKIDRVFTSALSTSPESKALITTLVQLGKDLGLITLAEGVETLHEMDILQAERVNQAQGFLLARPLEPGKLENQLLNPLRPSRGDDPHRPPMNHGSGGRGLSHPKK